MCKLLLLFLPGCIQSHLRILFAGIKTYDVPPDYSGNSVSFNYFTLPYFNIHIMYNKHTL